MPFKTAGTGDGDHAKNDSGLPLHWSNLRDGCCPKCGDELVSFDHLDLFKCMCGFKIGKNRMAEILDSQDANIDRVYNGFGYSDYGSDAPF